MKHLTIQTNIRKLSGNSVKKLRRQGRIPAVVYGKMVKEPILLETELNVFLKLYKFSGKTAVVDVIFDDKKIPCLVQDVDLDPVKDIVRHVDFLMVDLKKKVEAEVPIKFVSEPAKGFEGVLVKQLNALEVEALPESIPHEIEVDLSRLEKVGDSIHVSDILSTDVKYVVITEHHSIIASLVAEKEEASDEVVSTEGEQIEVEGSKEGSSQQTEASNQDKS